MRGKVKRLSFDKAFGILSRQGLDERLRKIKKNFSFIFIDFCDVGRLNEKLGYTLVNRLFNNIFRGFTFRKTDIVGRWFSGDEILIITFEGDVEMLLYRFMEFCKYRLIRFNNFFHKDVSKEEMYSILNKI